LRWILLHNDRSLSSYRVLSKWNLLLSWCKYVFKLCRFNVSSFDRYNRMLGMHRWVVLRIHRPVNSDENMRIWLLLDFVSVRLLELCSRHLFGVCIIDSVLELYSRHFRFHHRIYCMYYVHCWVVLLNDGTIGCDWSMRRWLVFGIFSDSLFELLHWYISSIHGDNFMHGMYCRIILRNDGTFGCNRRLRSWILFCCVSFFVHELRDWLF